MELFSDGNGKDLERFFNDRPRNVSVCTVNALKEPNIAIINSSRIAENKIEFEVGESSTLRNIESNKSVAFIIVKEGKTLMEYKGIRIYGSATEIQTTGEKLERARAILRERVGEKEAAAIKATVICKIDRIRPLVDRGQGWEKSI